MIGYQRDFYRPQRSWGKVIFSQASVILLTGGVPAQGGLIGGVSAPGGSGPRGRCLLPRCVPGGDPPGQPLLRAVRILLECILVQVDFCCTVQSPWSCKKVVSSVVSVTCWQTRLCDHYPGCIGPHWTFSGYWSTYVWQAGDTHPTGMLSCLKEGSFETL